MIPVLEVPLQQDLSEFTACLWRNGIAHRVVEDERHQVVWLESAADAEQVQQLFAHWLRGGSLDTAVLTTLRKRRFPPSPPLRKVPVTLLLIAFSGLFSLLIDFGQNMAVMSAFSFTPFSLEGTRLQYVTLEGMLLSGQWWRLLTPIFMHFSEMHILFNMLWVWVVGGRMEASQGSISLCGLVLFSGVLSNLCQFWVTGPMFGGMSGVVFALLGYSWLWDRRGHMPRFGLPPALIGFVVLWLVLGFTGVLEGMGLGSIANTAHLAGLVAGLLWVPIGRLLQRRDSSSL